MGSRRLFVAGAMLLAAAMPARAQWGFPGGFDAFGWGGWGATTALGDEARGMGMFAAGMGQYNLNTAQAVSINTDTVMRFNEYIFQSQQIRNQRYFQQLAERRDRVTQTARTTFERLRNNPETADIRRGDALNVLLDELTAPGVYAASVSAAQQPIPASLVKNIRFMYARQAVTISLAELARSVPPVLRDTRFDAELKALLDASVRARTESEQDDQVSSETLQAVRTAVRSLEAKVRATLTAGPDLRRAESFLKAAYGLARLLDAPDLGPFVKELDTVPNTTMACLLGFMHTFNLRFAAAQTPGQRTAYDQLFPLLRAIDDQVFPQGKAPVSIVTEAATPAHPEYATEFFSGMQMQDVQERKPLDPAPAP